MARAITRESGLACVRLRPIYLPRKTEIFTTRAGNGYDNRATQDLQKASLQGVLCWQQSRTPKCKTPLNGRGLHNLLE